MEGAIEEIATSPFVAEVTRLENYLDDSQKQEILDQINCLTSRCPCSNQVRPHHSEKIQKKDEISQTSPIEMEDKCLETSFILFEGPENESFDAGLVQADALEGIEPVNLSQPGGEIIPNIVLQAPPDFRTSGPNGDDLKNSTNENLGQKDTNEEFDESDINVPSLEDIVEENEGSKDNSVNNSDSSGAESETEELSKALETGIIKLINS